MNHLPERRTAGGGIADGPVASPGGVPPLEGTRELWRQASGVLASGLWSPSSGMAGHDDATFPLLAERGEGCRLVDTNGCVYVDWMNAPTILGYRHPEVERAVVEQLRTRGALLSLLQPLEIETARLVRELVPCADVVAFGKNGSDPLAVAVRIARAATGREEVLVCSYHGFHDWYMAAHAWCEGIPRAVRETVRTFPYGDLDALRRLLAEHSGRIAAVVLEPTSVTLPPRGYLEGVRELTLEHDVLLVFDEVVTAFRLARGGGQELFGVRPDLACLGKSMANGLPLSALTGKREVMETIARVGYGITFRGDGLALAACRATLGVIANEPVCERLALAGTTIRAGFDAACSRHAVRGELLGHPSRMALRFEDVGRITNRGLQSLFLQECMRHGVLSNGMFLASAAHDDAAIAQTVHAFDVAIGTLAGAIAASTLRGRLHIPPFELFGIGGPVEREA